jgi:hypothetical protein
MARAEGLRGLFMIFLPLPCMAPPLACRYRDTTRISQLAPQTPAAHLDLMQQTLPCPHTRNCSPLAALRPKRRDARPSRQATRCTAHSLHSLHVRDDDIPTTHIAVAVEGVSWSSPVVQCSSCSPSLATRTVHLALHHSCPRVSRTSSRN